MYWLDSTLLILLGLGVWMGARAGLVWQIARVVCLGLAVGGTVLGNEAASQMIQKSMLQGADPRLAQGLAYLGLFLSIYLAAYFVSRLVYEAVRAADLVAFDRLLGALVGLLKVGVIVSAACLCLSKLEHPVTQDMMTRSKLAPILADSMDSLWKIMPEEYRSQAVQVVEALNSRWRSQTVSETSPKTESLPE